MKSIIPPRLGAIIRSRLGTSAPPPEDAPSTVDRRDPSEIRGGTYRPRRAHENHVDAPCVMLSDGEIVRALRRFRYDPAFRGERRVPIKTLADCVGLSHETVYQAMMRGTVSDCTRAKLSWALIAINDCRLQFSRRGQVWQVKTGSPLLR